MSYRELRNFTEILRSLGFPRPISIENFRTPNFKLIAEILKWLIDRYDADADIPLEIDTEQDRVIFIKTATLFLVQKARIKVNPKKLYQADGHAVQELLKVATVLYEAAKRNVHEAESTDDPNALARLARSVNSKLDELRISRRLASEITEKAAALHDLLGKEVNLREQRTSALAKTLDIQEIEKSLHGTIRATEDDIKQTMKNLDNVASDEINLDAKIEKRKNDLERQQKRLAQIQAVRPAYMDEYEKLETELNQLYEVYILKFRNLAYIEKLYGDFDRAEQDRSLEAEQSLKKMAERLREEEKVANQKLDEMPASHDLSPETHNLGGGKIYGTITGAGMMSDDDEDSQSLLSDDDDEEDELRLDPANPGTARPEAAGRRGRTAVDASDEMSDLSDEISRPMAPTAGPKPSSATSEKQEDEDSDDF